MADKMRQYEQIHVECYSGFKANERLKAFTYMGSHWDIEEIIDRWYEGGMDPSRPAVGYFKVRSSEGQIFILRYLSLFDAWSVLADD